MREGYGCPRHRWHREANNRVRESRGTSTPTVITRGHPRSAAFHPSSFILLRSRNAAGDKDFSLTNNIEIIAAFRAPEHRNRHIYVHTSSTCERAEKTRYKKRRDGGDVRRMRSRYRSRRGSCYNRKVSCSGRRQASEHHLATALTYVTGSHNNFTLRGIRYTMCDACFLEVSSFSFAGEKKDHACRALVVTYAGGTDREEEQVLIPRWNRSFCCRRVVALFERSSDTWRERFVRLFYTYRIDCRAIINIIINNFQLVIFGSQHI